MHVTNFSRERERTAGIAPVIRRWHYEIITLAIPARSSSMVLTYPAVVGTAMVTS